jgi:hypothetical protein
LANRPKNLTRNAPAVNPGPRPTSPEPRGLSTADDKFISFGPITQVHVPQ